MNAGSSTACVAASVLAVVGGVKVAVDEMGQTCGASSPHKKSCSFGGFAFFLHIENGDPAFLLNPEASSTSQSRACILQGSGAAALCSVGVSCRHSAHRRIGSGAAGQGSCCHLIAPLLSKQGACSSAQSNPALDLIGCFPRSIPDFFFLVRGDLLGDVRSFRSAGSQLQALPGYSPHHKTAI